MKKKVKFLSVIIFLLLAIIICLRTGQTSIQKVASTIRNSNTQENLNSQYVEGEVIIMKSATTNIESMKVQSSLFRSTSLIDKFEVEKLCDFNQKNNGNLQQYSMRNNNSSQKGEIFLVRSNEYNTEELINKLKNINGILSVEPNYILHTTEMTNDAYIDYQWAIDNKGQNGGTVGADINPIATTNNNEKVVAVVDTGVDYTHEDLKGSMWSNSHSELGKIGGHGYDFGYELVNETTLREAFDDDPMDDSKAPGHGTSCAGIIAAQSNNNIGITNATMGSSNISIMALKIVNSDGEMYSSAAIKAYDYISKALDLGVNVVGINNSYGYYSKSKEDSALKNKIDEVGRKGALSICASGNDGYLINGDQYLLPACIDSEYIISVAASDERDNLASFSNYSYEEVDIAAPGSNILTTVPYNVFNPTIYTKEQRNNLCDTYEDYENVSNINDKVDFTETDGTVTVDSQMYFGKKGGKSLKWTIPNAEERKGI